jgi:hypothetical protein
MKWTEACNLTNEFQVLIDPFNNLNVHGDDKVQNEKVLTSYKYRMFYALLRQHRQPPFRLENAE